MCVLTFDPHPAAVVGAGAPALLTTFERRAELVGALGARRLYVRTFDAAFAAWEPEHFARELVASVLAARSVVVGENFRFGAKRAGDLALLRQVGATLGFEVSVASVARDERGPFSSTRVRKAVLAGDLDEARHVLGRPHALTGVVVHGDARGRTLQFPTANVDGVAELMPPNGVYAVQVAIDEGERGPTASSGPAQGTVPGVANLGVRPTVGGTRLSLEVHLLDFSRDIYGARLRVDLAARLREEKKFSSLDELKAQIARDVAEARRVLSSG